MKTKRVSKTTTISLPPGLYQEAMELARAKGMTRSELFREALRRYQRDEQEWQDLLAYGRRKAKLAGIRSEADVERLVDAGRK
ncbi:MAG TPA: CopG family transcriptional regulator [Elusimicrobia bacterium]|nr:CopG family transcriptional regulator [Elusimicrobiota bacterium]